MSIERIFSSGKEIRGRPHPSSSTGQKNRSPFQHWASANMGANMYKIKKHLQLCLLLDTDGFLFCFVLFCFVGFVLFYKTAGVTINSQWGALL
jgi:hypothetical protein